MVICSVESFLLPDNLFVHMQPLFCKLNLNNLPPHDILSPRQHHFSSCLFTRCFPGCSRLRIDRLGKTIQYVYDIQNGAYEELEHAVDRDPDSSLQLDEFVDHCVMKYFDSLQWYGAQAYSCVYFVLLKQDLISTRRLVAVNL